MTEFKQIVQLRNVGKTQKEIAAELGLSERTIRNYLKSGSIPCYERSVPTRPNPLSEEHLAIAHEMLRLYPKIEVKRILRRLKEEGYKGSYKTLLRRLESVTRVTQPAPIFFQREHFPGDLMEGDFTELAGISIGGEVLKVQLWVVRLIYSGRISATAFFNTTWECFLEGSVQAFCSFGGIAKRYRLDNLSPVVKLLSKRERKITSRFTQFQNHYGFKTDFCNPASGWEKGSIESTVGIVKTRIREVIGLGNLHFKDLASFQELVLRIVDEYNSEAAIEQKFEEENLSPLPREPFPAFEEVVVSIDKYATCSPLKNGHRYSAPSYLSGLSIEARVYVSRIDLIYESKVVASHSRLRGKPGQVRIDLLHIIGELCKKPGVVLEWKHRHVLFSHPTWNRFYEKLKNQPNNESASMKEYLRCLKHMTDYGKDNVTAAMELCLEDNRELSSLKLKEVLTNEPLADVLSIKPIRRNLSRYDELFTLQRKENQ
ncbi:MAG: IS21 family transposase [Bdellovibrionia bacterium]